MLSFSAMSVELEEADLPLTEAEEAPLAPEKKGAGAAAKKASALSPSKKKKNSKKKNQPGKYSQLVVESIRKLGERNGSSLAKIYNEAKKVPWFDQQNGRTYLKYSIKALVQNDTLLQVKGTGANGSFKLNRKKLEGGAGEGGGPAIAPHVKPHKKAAAVVATPPKKAEKKPKALEKKSSHKKGASPSPAAAKKEKAKAKKAGAAAGKKSGAPSPSSSASASSPAAKKAKKAAKPKPLKSRK
ncbi:histone H1.10 [Anolis sagrei]|uniref:histone H1.10 n=1 Tax=Anolis sagrei TaxID=38937 RepID=UPI00295A56F6|nr:histone H1.10 [Anolis sagrei ordinatus]